MSFGSYDCALDGDLFDECGCFIALLDFRRSGISGVGFLDGLGEGNVRRRIGFLLICIR